MTQAMTATLKARDGAVIGPCDETGCVTQAFKRRVRVHHIEHLLRILLPVSGQSNNTACSDDSCEQLDERRLDQAPFVMALFMPRVGKENMHFIKAMMGKSLAEYLDGVMTEHTNVG